MAKHNVNVVIQARDLASKNFNKVGRAGASMGQMLKTAAATVGVAFGAAGFVTAVKNIINIGSVAEEIASKFNAVFKEEAAAANQFGENLAGSVGRSKVEMQGFLATLQDTFVPLGFARREAREMSQTMVQLAIDMASFNNTNDADAIRDLQSAIVGNHETMRKYGVIITQATLSQELLNMGMEGGAKNATEQQKATARLNLILKGTTDAQGDAERTAGSFANQWKKLKAQLTDAGVKISNFLLPPLTELLKGVNGLTIASVQSAAKIGIWAASIGGAVLIAPKIVKGIQSIIKAMKALAAGQAIVQSLSGPAGWAALAVGVGIAAASVTALTLEFDHLTDELETATVESAEVASGLSDVEVAAVGAGQALDALAIPDMKARSSGIKSINREIESLRKSVEDFGKTKEEILLANIARAHGLDEVPGVTRREIQGLFQQQTGLKEAAKQAELYSETMAGLQRQVSTFGLSANEVNLFDLIKSGASNEQITAAKKLVDQVTRLQAEADREKDQQKRDSRKDKDFSRSPLEANESRFLTMAGRRDPAVQTEKNTSAIARYTKATAKSMDDLMKRLRSTRPISSGTELLPSNMM